MKKIISFVCVSVLGFVLVGCGDKNIITYDFLTDKVTLSDNFDESIQLPADKHYAVLLSEMVKHCNLTEEDYNKATTQMLKEGEYTSSTCKNGAVYKFINMNK
ncbi:hypothetical protein GQ597_00750 [Gilliamella sp. Pra-s65]|uniref:hypothetical protein n=1 Tax=unclassified Gilliamella TaxID=2685620 RepID=UPI001365DA86|nr:MULTISPECIES: hypothetical protein [unclassified Gilliamella]MWN89252.1 hypothetical protein [Gilliamella sp. Pra-s65]MWP72295.1 hypothetical protein [Gilliamella sp. Pra-s52]